MYAVFEDNQFVKLINENESNVYQLEPRFLLYRIDEAKHKYRLDMYKFCLDIDCNLLVYLDESKLLSDKIPVQIKPDARVDINLNPLTTWQKIKQFLGIKS